MFYQIPAIHYNDVLEMSHRWFLSMSDYKNKVLEEEQKNYGKLGRSQTNNQSRNRRSR
jgi:hypothetical protein